MSEAIQMASQASERKNPQRKCSDKDAEGTNCKRVKNVTETVCALPFSFVAALRRCVDVCRSWRRFETIHVELIRGGFGVVLLYAEINTGVPSKRCVAADGISS